jgi:C-terminal processing protease CtpA/Prc
MVAPSANASPGAAPHADSPAERRTGGAWLLAILLGAVLAAVHVDTIEPRTRPRAQAEDIRRVVKSHYYRDVEGRDLEYGAIRGMVGALDPYSTFFTPEEAKAFSEDTEGHFAGLGIEITVEQGYVKVIAPIA